MHERQGHGAKLRGGERPKERNRMEKKLREVISLLKVCTYNWKLISTQGRVRHKEEDASRKGENRVLLVKHVRCVLLIYKKKSL